MALYDRRFDQATPRSALGNLMPFILAAAIAALLMMILLFPRPAAQLGGTNADPAMRTVTPQPLPSTSPVVPTQSPTTDPRPTQTPIR